MPRCNNWPSALIAFILSKQFVPFKWGENDCCLFAADWVKCALGYDPAATFRSAYDSALGAQRLLGQLGGVEAIADAHFSRNKAIAYTRRGDLISFRRDDDTLALGVCEGANGVFPSVEGIIRFPVLAGQTSWRVD